MKNYNLIKSLINGFGDFHFLPFYYVASHLGFYQPAHKNAIANMFTLDYEIDFFLDAMTTKNM